jgi:hypothetical protein
MSDRTCPECGDEHGCLVPRLNEQLQWKESYFHEHGRVLDLTERLMANAETRDRFQEALEWLASCNPDTNNVNAIAEAALNPKEAS